MAGGAPARRNRTCTDALAFLTGSRQAVTGRFPHRPQIPQNGRKLRIAAFDAHLYTQEVVVLNVGRLSLLGENETAELRRTAVLVDEHPLWLDAVEQVLQRVSVHVVGRARSFAEGQRLVDELTPDLLVAEISGPDEEVSGVSWLLDLREQYPELKTIVLSIVDDPAAVQAAFAAGAVAFVVKKAHPDDLAVAVRQAYEHSIFLPGYIVANDPYRRTPSTTPTSRGASSRSFDSSRRDIRTPNSRGCCG